MCEHQRTALQMIKEQPRKGGLSRAAIALHEQQCKDAEELGARMKNVEDKVDSLEKRMEGVDRKVDDILKILETRESFRKSLKEILTNKVFIYLLITLLTLLAGKEAAEVGLFVMK